MTSERDSFLSALHGVGVLLAMTVNGRWYGICHDNGDRFWLVEGKVTSADDIKENGLATTDHCHTDTYEKALVAFRYWWDSNFVSVPICEALKLVR